MTSNLTIYTTNNTQIQQTQANMLKTLLQKHNEYDIVDSLYSKIIQEYDVYCLEKKEKDIKAKEELIVVAKNKIQELQNKISELESKIQEIITPELLSIKESGDFEGDKTLHLNLKAIELKNTLASKEQSEIVKCENSIHFILENITNIKKEIDECKAIYLTRYTKKVDGFAFSNELQNEINNNKIILEKVFTTIKNHQSNVLCNIYDKIIYLLTNSNVFVKAEDRDLTAREWFIDLSYLSYFQFEKTRKYYKKHNFLESNKLKEFLSKAEEVKNIEFLL